MLYAEWSAELDELLHRAAGRPLTRLFRGVLYSAGLLLQGPTIAQELGDPELTRPDAVDRANATPERDVIDAPKTAEPLLWLDPLRRIDAMRRTFTARRFGTGYDAIQVNRQFDAIIASLSGRSGVSLVPADLDPTQFNLVPGG